jgi:hypothetical protein
MDPNAALARQRQLAQEILRTHYLGEELNRFAVAELAEVTDNLDEWLRKGGALPDAWEDARPFERGVVPRRRREES